MKILVLNSGSSSLKFKLFEMPQENVIFSGDFQKIGLKDSFFNIDNQKNIQEINNHEKAIQIILEKLIQNKIISDISQIKAFGHRIVQGGEYFKKSQIINDLNFDELLKTKKLAPLHNPINIKGIEIINKISKKIINVAVFDTSFHTNLPAHNFLMPIDYELYEKQKIRKYGAHGISHEFVFNELKKLKNAKIDQVITCHIGNGASISAIKEGKVLNTSMGMTPLGGLIMGTRSGDIDPSILEFIDPNKTVTEHIYQLNNKSGLLGISGISNDFRDITKSAEKNNKRAIIAREMYFNKIVDYIFSYTAQLDGVQSIVLTAGVGENSNDLQKFILEKTKILGSSFDDFKQINDNIKILTNKKSKIDIYVIKTNEELAIAKETYELIK